MTPVAQPFRGSIHQHRRALSPSQADVRSTPRFQICNSNSVLSRVARRKSPGELSQPNIRSIAWPVASRGCCKVADPRNIQTIQISAGACALCCLLHPGRPPPYSSSRVQFCRSRKNTVKPLRAPGQNGQQKLELDSVALSFTVTFRDDPEVHHPQPHRETHPGPFFALSSLEAGTKVRDQRSQIMPASFVLMRVIKLAQRPYCIYCIGLELDKKRNSKPLLGGLSFRPGMQRLRRRLARLHASLSFCFSWPLWRRSANTNTKLQE